MIIQEIEHTLRAMGYLPHDEYLVDCTVEEVLNEEFQVIHVLWVTALSGNFYTYPL